jgi:hypothetical protein
VNETETGLSLSRLRAINILAGAESNGTDVAGCESEAVAGWLRDDPEFIAGLNRAKSFRRDRLRADVLSLASDAMATLRELVSGPDVAPAVRLRASLAILQAADALNVEESARRRRRPFRPRWIISGSLILWVERTLGMIGFGK